MRAVNGPWQGGARWHQGVITRVYKDHQGREILYDGHHTKDKNDGKDCNYNGYAPYFQGLRLEELRSCPTMEKSGVTQHDAAIEGGASGQTNTIGTFRNAIPAAPQTLTSRPSSSEERGMVVSIESSQSPTTTPEPSSAADAILTLQRTTPGTSSDASSEVETTSSEGIVSPAIPRLKGSINSIDRSDLRQQATFQNDHSINNNVASPSMNGGNEVQNIVVHQMNNVLKSSDSASDGERVTGIAPPTTSPLNRSINSIDRSDLRQQATFQNDHSINNNVASPSMNGGNEVQDIVVDQMNNVLKF